MGREFLDVFEAWAENYDQAVTGHDDEYKAVFHHYEDILKNVVQKAGCFVLEFGTGTGNLTELLALSGKQVYGIEPSEPMRMQALKKLPAGIQVADGDFLDFPLPDSRIDTIVSTYAFHHLTDREKGLAVTKYGRLLPTGGKIVFADTVFVDQNAFHAAIAMAKKQNFLSLAKDLETEYYTTQPVLKEIFERNGFSISFTAMNEFVWIIEAVKK